MTDIDKILEGCAWARQADEDGIRNLLRGGVRCLDIMQRASAHCVGCPNLGIESPLEIAAAVAKPEPPPGPPEAAGPEAVEGPEPAEVPEQPEPRDADVAPAAKNEIAATRSVERESQATKLIRLVEDLELFGSPEGKPFSSFRVKNHMETHAVRSRAFRTFLQGRYHENFRSALSSKALQDAIGVLESKALFGGVRHPVFCRVAHADGNLYLDLGTENWSAVEVTPEGWGITPRPPVKFRRARGLLALPVPRRDPDAAEHFRGLLNLKADSHDWELIVGWELAAMRPRGPFPVLGLNSEAGSGKTTTSRLLRSIIDSNEAPVRANPRDERDLMIAAANGWVVALDNVSHIPEWLSDGLCRLSTGGGFSTRELFSDDEEILFNLQRPVIINGIEEICTRGDLVDRSLIVQLPPIPDNRRIPEDEFWARAERCRAGILAHLLDAAVGALANIDGVRLENLPRMADFAKWVAAAEATLGWEEGHFADVYNQNRREVNDLTLDASPIARHLREIVTSSVGQWQGTAAQLAAELDRRASDHERRLKNWPNSPRAVSNAIRRLIPNLRKAGLGVDFTRSEERTRDRLMVLREVSGE